MATKTVDLGSVIGPQGPAGADGKTMRAARFVVGTSTAGWTADDCDYLCDGTADEAEINAAIQALPSVGGEVVILDGTYQCAGRIALNKANVTLSGNGKATTLYIPSLISSGESALILVTGANVTIRNMKLDVNKNTAISSSALNTTILNCLFLMGDSEDYALYQAGTYGIVIGNRFTADDCPLCLYMIGSGHIFVGNILTASGPDGSVNFANNSTGSVVANNIGIS